MTYTVIIPTYNRPHLLLRVIKKLHGCRIKIYDDGSTKDYTKVKQYLARHFDSYSYHRLPENLGKQGFYKLHQMMYGQMQGEKYDYLLQLPDDMIPSDDFVHIATERLKECGADLLNPIILPHHSEEWCKKEIPFRIINGRKYWQMNWFECFITTPVYLNAMQHTCPAVNTKIFKNPKSSSGVGWVISQAFSRAGGKIMVVDNSLLTHVGDESMMLPGREPRTLKY